MIALLHRLRRQESGQALVEFAVYASVFILILVGIADYVIYTHLEMEITAAASAGAAYGTIPGNSKNTAGITLAASSAAPDVSGMTVTINDVYACSPGGTAVPSTTLCSDGYSPLMFVQFATSANAPALLKWSGISSHLTLQGFASFEVPWTS